MSGATFHESWYKVAPLKVRLHISLKIHRQVYRGKTWYVIRDPGNNQFFRINHTAYQFIALLNGQRTVDESWTLCYEEHGDEAPSQGEAISLLGQLFSSNLLQGDVPQDTEIILKRHHRRRKRETTAYFKGILFARIPIFDPHHILDKWCWLFGPLFSRTGYILGGLLLLAGIFSALSNFDTLSNESQSTLSVSNLPLLYLVFAITKLLHEFGHGFACHYYGHKNGNPARVHTLGIAFLFLTPVPYVDATASWSFQSKWHRMAVAAGGMYVELLIAAMATLVWANTGESDVIHILAWNTIVVCSVSTLLFNGNPLLRYDAYYILSDFLEIPNLSGRSKLYMKYLFRKYLFGVSKATSPAYDYREALQMVLYGILSELYKLVIFCSIIFLLSEVHPVLGLLGIAMYTFSALLSPLGQLIKYIATAPELARTRLRAAQLTLAISGATAYLLTGIELNDSIIVEGVIEPRTVQKVHILSDGFTEETLKLQTPVEAEKTLLIKGGNPELAEKIKETEAQIEELYILIRSYAANDPARKAIQESSLKTQLKKLKLLQDEKRSLTLLAPASGVFIPTHTEEITGKYFQKGEEIGMIISANDLFIRSIIDQSTVRVLDDAKDEVVFRVRGNPEEDFPATIENIMQAGLNKLPSAALGYLGGGEASVKQKGDGTETDEFFFEISLKLKEQDENLKAGQIVYIRYEMPKKSIYNMTISYINRLLLKRFKI
jgi:putative peptide zinc metalloprotease protein